MGDTENLGGLAPAWNEILLTVLPLVVVLAVLVLVAMFLVPSTRDVADDVVVEGRSAAELDQALFTQLRTLKRWTIVDARPGVFGLSRVYTPGWCFVVAVVAFPVGLIALLLRRHHAIQLTLTDQSQGCRIRVVGSAPKRDIVAVAAAIQAALPDRSVLA